MDNCVIFQEFIKKANKQIKDILCHNFAYVEGNKYSSGQDNSLFIVYLKKKYKWIKISHRIHGSVDGLRFKMYYASTPENAFCEEQSYELGFMDGEEYTYLLKLSENGSDALRFDFGFKPINFVLQSFQLTELSFSEIFRRHLDNLFNSIRAIFQFIGRDRVDIKRIIRKLRREGLKNALKSAQTVALNAQREASMDKTSIQVVEPYRVTIQKELLPERKKVLHFIENFYTGGSSRLIIDIIEHYGHQYDHKIFTMAYRGADEFLDVDVTVIDIEDKKKVLELIKEYSPDIIHTHIWEGEWYHKVFSLLEEVTGSKMIENINTPIEPIIKNFIDKYVFVSHYVLEKFHDGNDEKSMVIYPGSNFDLFTRKLEGDYLAEDTIGMVYRLGYDKLNQYSIDVFIKTVQKRPQTKAIIVGGGPQYEYYLNKVKNAGVMESFTFTGYVPYMELPSWYQKFTVFVAPVWKESFGQVSPFAMSMGMPVVGYDIGAINEIISNESLLAPADDSDRLSDILVDLLNDYSRCKEIGHFNQERAWRNFGVKTMVDEYANLYDELTR